MLLYPEYERRIMNKELDDKLTQSCPILYGDKHSDVELWGFQCGDGWFDILWDLSQKLEHLIKQWIKEHPKSGHIPRASVVKEKFGGLRFYMTCATPEMQKHIDSAERLSLTTCEVCGAIGEKRMGARISTLCDQHNQERQMSLNKAFNERLWSDDYQVFLGNLKSDRVSYEELARQYHIRHLK